MNKFAGLVSQCPQSASSILFSRLRTGWQINSVAVLTLVPSCCRIRVIRLFCCSRRRTSCLERFMTFPLWTMR